MRYRISRNSISADEQDAVVANGMQALHEALTAEGTAYAVSLCEAACAEARDGARNAADAAQLGPADRRAFLGYLAVFARTRVLNEATDRRDREVYYASWQLTEWLRSMGARHRSVPQSLRPFEEG